MFYLFYFIRFGCNSLNTVDVPLNNKQTSGKQLLFGLPVLNQINLGQISFTYGNMPALALKHFQTVKLKLL